MKNINNANNKTVLDEKKVEIDRKQYEQQIV